jgi:hypothetical protein
MEDLYTLDNDLDFTNCTTNCTNCIYNTNNNFINELQQKSHMIGINKTQYRININASFTYRKKGFLRVLLPNDDDLTINNALEDVNKLVVIHVSNDVKIYEINMKLNLLLLKTYGLEITTIDVEQFLTLHSDDEINQLIHTSYNNVHTFNSKFIFENKTGFYLDIPLIEEFYSCDQYIWNNFVSNNFISYDIKSYDDKMYNCDNILKKVSIQFEENIFDENKNITNMMKIANNYKILDTKCIKCSLEFLNEYVLCNILDCKFIFFIIENGTHMLPQLNNIILYDNYFDRSTQISLDNVIIYNQNDKVIYGISTNENCDMNNLIENIKDENEYIPRYINNIKLTFDDNDETLIVTTIIVTRHMKNIHNINYSS